MKNDTKTSERLHFLSALEVISMLLAKTVQVYSKCTVMQQEMWKKYPILKVRKLQDTAGHVLPEVPSLPLCLFS